LIYFRHISGRLISGRRSPGRRISSAVASSLLLAALIAPGQDAAGQSAAGGQAADEPAGAAPLSSSDAGSAGNWLETRVAVEELRDAGDFDAALALEARLIELVMAQFGADSRAMADAYRLLASVHRERGDFEEAEEQLLMAIEIYEHAAGPVAPDLIDPYVELGGTYYDAGDYAGAISAYGEARTIGRRNFGLLNEEQLPIVDLMTDAADRLGDIEEAKNLQEDALTLIERVHGESSLEAIDAQYKYAHWLRSKGLYEEELRLYYDVQRIIDDEYDDDPLMLVRNFRERAMSYRAAHNANPLGLSGLGDALDLLESMPEPPTLLLAEVLVERGDWFVQFDRASNEVSEYLRAWQLLGQLDNGSELRKEWFDSLHVVELPGLSQRGLSNNPADPEGHVVVYFTVDTTGRTRDVEITESEPPGLKDGAVNRLMRLARFRPKVSNGVFAPARRAYRWEFRYLAVDGVPFAD
jgi:TonB family protein